jgi:hypothetical protein
VARVSTALRLRLNPRKSGVLLLHLKAPMTPAEGHIGGIPFVEEYGYLGTLLGRTLSASPHLAKAGRRATYVSRRLWLCRSELDLRFSANLFQMLLPAVRMLGTLHQQLPGEQGRIEVEVRRQFRTFCLLPWTCPNELVAIFLGDTGDLLRGIARSAEHKSTCRRNGVPLGRTLLRPTPSILVRNVPRKLARLIKAMWGAKCADHGKTLTRTHLHESHGLQVDPLALLRAAQQSHYDHGQLKAICWAAIQKVELLAPVTVERASGRRKRGVRRP